MTMACELVQEYGAAFVLNALEPDEQRAVEEHLARCPRCAREIGDLELVGEQLARAVPQHEPPPALRERVLAAARAETADGASAAPPRPLAFPSARQRADQPDPDQTEQRTAGKPGRPSWLAIGTLAAALAALIWGASLQAQLAATQRQLAETAGQLERLRGAYGAVVGVLASPDTSVYDLQGREGAPEAQGKVWVNPDSGQGMMMARGLPALPDGQAYQVWLVNAQGRVSGGFLRPYGDDVYYTVLQAPGKLTEYQSIGVTREPAVGSPGPTGPRIIGGEI